MCRPQYKEIARALAERLLAASPNDVVAVEALAVIGAAYQRQIERTRQQYRANPEPAIQRARARRAVKREEVNASRRARYLADHERKVEKGRQYAAKRAETGKAAAYRQENREAQRSRSRARSAAAGDDYARELLAKGSPLSSKDFPQQLVELKKIEIQLKRALK